MRCRGKSQLLVLPRHLTDADYSTPLWLVHNKPNTSPMSVLGTVKEPGDNNVFVITLEQLYALPDQERVVWLFDAEQARKVWLKHTAEPQIDASAVGGKHLAAPRCVGPKRWKHGLRRSSHFVCMWEALRWL